MIFDWKKVKDNNTGIKTSQAPAGIEMVFNNGHLVLKDGNVDTSVLSGVVL